MGEKIIMLIVSIYFKHVLERLGITSPSKDRILCYVKILSQISLLLSSVPDPDFKISILDSDLGIQRSF